MCALCAIWHLQACLAAIATCIMSAHTCTHACNLSASRLLAACGAKVRHENHSDKLLCENFTMKRIFRPKAVRNTGRRRCAIQAEGGAIRVIIGMFSATGYGRRLRSLQGEAYANRSYPFHGLIFACLHAGWPPRHCLHARTFHMQYAPPSRYLTNINT